MKRILFINDRMVGGGAEIVFKTTYELFLKNDNFIVEYFIQTQKEGKPKNIFDYIFSYNTYKLLYKKLVDFQPSIIHIHNYTYLLSPSVLFAIKKYKKNKNCKVIHTAHDHHLLSPNSGFVKFNIKTKEVIRLKQIPNIYEIIFSLWDYRGWAYSIAKQLQWIISYKILKFDSVFDIIVTPSDYLANLFLQKYKSIDIITVRNPYDGKIKIKQENNKKNKILKIIYSGRIEWEKGIYLFAKIIKNINLPIELHLYGEGREYKKIKSLNSNKIFLYSLLPHNKMIKKYIKYDILVQPTIIYESASLTIVEAKANGLNVMSSDFGGLKEINEITGGGYYIDVFDNNQVIYTLTKIHNDFLNKNIQCNIKNLEQFSLKEYFENIKKIYFSN